MSILNKFNTVYFKLIASYTMIIFLVTMVIGLTSYFYFSDNFNREVTRINHQLLKYQKKMTDENVFRQAENVYIQLVTAQNDNPELNLLYEHPYIGHHAKIRSVHQHLMTTVANHSELLEAIDIYFRHNDMVISSQSGMSVLGAPSMAQEQDALAWLDKMQHSDRSLLWMAVDQEASDAVYLVGSYPFNAAGSSNAGIIAIRLKNDALLEAISVASEDPVGHTYILSPEGHVLLNNADLWMPLDSELQTHIQSSKLLEDHYTVELDGSKSIVSHLQLSPAGWRLATVTPVEQYYRASSTIQSKLLLFSGIAICIGFILSYWFAFRIYNPLKTILIRTRRLFADELPAPSSNEFKAIDNMIDNLSGKIDHLEATLEANQPLIKHHLANGLLLRTLTDSNDLNERLRILNLTMEGFRLQAAILLLDGHEHWHTLSDENRQFLRYSLIEQLEQASSQSHFCLAILLSDTEIGVIYGWNGSDTTCATPHFRRLMEQLNSYLAAQFGSHAAAAVGAFVDSPFKLHESYEMAAAAAKHRYFHPDRPVLDEQHWSARERNAEQMPYEWLDDFSTALTNRKLEDIRNIAEKIVEQMRNGPYAAEHCHHYWRELVARYYRHLKAMNCTTREVVPDQLLEQLGRINNILQFKQWLLNVIDLTFDYLEEKGKQRHANLVHQIKSYISGHLESDLSLQSLAEHVYLSPRYLSKIFKQETGMNFVDYINRERLIYAKELIVSTDLNVDQIAQKAGFNSTAYFIKKFKETYRKTPKTFKQDHIGAADTD